MEIASLNLHHLPNYWHPPSLKALRPFLLWAQHLIVLDSLLAAITNGPPETILASGWEILSPESQYYISLTLDLHAVHHDNFNSLF